MSRVVCLLLLGHAADVVGARPIHLTSDTYKGPTTDVVYRCRRCQHVWTQNVRGTWTPEQVTKPVIRIDTSATERSLAALHTKLDNLKEITMASDRDLLVALADGVVALSGPVDNLIADRDQWKSRALAAEGREATDEAEDTAAAQPIRDALNALTEKLAPVASSAPTPIEEVPEAVSGAPDVSPDETA